MFDVKPTDPVTPPARDGVAGFRADGSPTVVSVSNVLGHLQPARNALLALADSPEFDPIVQVGPGGRLHWDGSEDYVDVPTRKGNDVCENTIRNNRGRDGGETVVVETPDRLVALVRTGGGVQTREFPTDEREHPT